MAALLELPTGSLVAPSAIQALESRLLSRPYFDRDGKAWPALLIVETRSQVLRVPFDDIAAANKLRDKLALAARSAA